MEVHQLDGHDHGLGHGVVELDICFGCQGIWFDHRENLKLSPQAVVELFTLLHQHRTDERRPLQRQLACPRCVRPLAQSFDVVRSGRYMVYRCAQQHGRFSAFSSFMVEKALCATSRARRWMIWPGAWTPSTARAAVRRWTFAKTTPARTAAPRSR